MDDGPDGNSGANGSVLDGGRSRDPSSSAAGLGEGREALGGQLPPAAEGGPDLRVQFYRTDGNFTYSVVFQKCVTNV